MRDVAIVSPLRTPVGKFGGMFRDLPAEDLGALVIGQLLARTGLDPERVDEVIMGQGYPSGENPSIGRLCALKAGLPLGIPGYQLDRRCASGLQSVLNAAMLVQTGNAEVVVAGGVESMSNVEYYTTDARWGMRLGSMTFFTTASHVPGLQCLQRNALALSPAWSRPPRTWHATLRFQGRLKITSPFLAIRGRMQP